MNETWKCGNCGGTCYEDRLHKCAKPLLVQSESAGSVTFGDVARAQNRGCNDFAAGVVVGDNPYPETHRLFWHWMKGWVDAGMKKPNA